MEDRTFFFQSGPKAVLLMHAYTSTPNDVRILGRSLERAGYTVYAPTFSGHGTADPEDILALTPNDWVQNAKDALAFLRGNGYEDIAVFGLSLGGVIATKMLLDEDVVAGGTFCSPVTSFRRNHVRENFLPFARALKRRAGWSPAEIEERLPLIEQRLDKQLAAIGDLVSSMEPEYGNLKKPVFIAQAGQDEMIDPEIAVQFKESLTQAAVDFHFYENSKHAITVGADREQLAKDLVHFLSRL